MAGEQMSALLQHLRRVFDAQATRHLSDGEALRRFAGERDESAFAALMQRHGPLVLGVCRQFLGHEQDAEDAFQATFLVLARQARSVRNERSVASWLYGVACRIAMKARRAAARRRRHESQAARAPTESLSGGTGPPADLGWRELQAVLAEELERLPEKYRRPFILCCLEARSKSEAADELGWKEGTVSSRLAHARKILQQRLARRGVTLSVVLAGLAVAREGAGAAVPTSLAVATLQAGPVFAAGGPPAVPGASAQALAWAHAMLRIMALARMKLPAVLLLLLAVAGAGVAALLPDRPEPPPPRAAVADPRPDRMRPQEAPAAPPEKPAAANMTIRGTVRGFTPPGKNDPLGAPRLVVLTNRHRLPGEAAPAAQRQLTVLGSGKGDDLGRFRFEVPQTTVEHNAQLFLLASVPGWAPAASRLDRLATAHDVPFLLRRALAVRGRLLGPGGEPAGGVRLDVTGLDSDSGLRLQFAKPPGPLPGWPESMTTDRDGRFVLHGVEANCRVYLEAHDERYATQRLTLHTGAAERANEVTLALAPPRVLEGRITGADTGHPLADVEVRAELEGLDSGPLISSVAGRTDAQGRFRLRPFPGKELSLWAYPPAGSPYLLTSTRFRWPGQAARHEAALAMRRGVLVRGRVTEAESGRPLAGAAVEHIPNWVRGGAPGTDPADRAVQRWPWDTRTGPDGSFALGVFPGEGHLLVRGPTPDYLHTEVSSGQLEMGRPGGRPYFPDGLVPLALPPGDDTRRVAVVLRRGVPVRGRVLVRDRRGDEKPVRSGVLLSPTYAPLGRELKGDPLPVRDGRFELPGCDPNQIVRVWFYDPSRHGACVEIPGKPGAEPVVRLTPCGSVVFRLVDRAGRPPANPCAMIDLVLRPGAAEDDPAPKGPVRVLVSGSQLYGRTHGVLQPRAGGPPGEIRSYVMIPGGTYALRAQQRVGWPVKRIFTMPPNGGELNLGDVVIDP